jgi:large subunit ribosomal protein L24e
MPMVEKRDCSFCGSAIEPGTGLMFVKRDGTRYQFCSSKCRRNLLDLGRVPRTVKWTKHYIKGLGKAAAMQAAQKKGKPAGKAPAAPAPAPTPVAPIAGGEGASAPAGEPAKTPAAKKKPAAPKAKE